MIKPFRQIWEILPKSHRRRLFSYFPLTLVSSLLELGGLVALLPFLWLMIEPAKLEEHPRVLWLLNSVGINTHGEILFTLGTGIVVAFLLRDILAIAILWYQSQTQARLQSALSCELLWKHLSQPYSWYIRQHSDFLRQSVSRLPRIAAHLLRPLSTFFSQLLHAGLMATVLIFLHPAATFILLSTLSLTCLLIYQVLIPRLTSVSLEARDSHVKKLKTAGAAFNAIKEAKLYSCEDYYLAHHQREAQRLARLESLSDVLGHLPAYLTRSIFSVVAIVTLYLVLQNSTDVGVAETGVFLIALSRLSRCTQNCIRSLGILQTQSAFLDELHQSLGDEGREQDAKNTNNFLGNQLESFQGVRLENVSFRYTADRLPALTDINLEIAAGETIAIVGSSRAGKSTLLDVMTGLLQPDSGDVIVNGHEVKAGGQVWGSLVGYVPQDSFYTDCSLAENVAIGVDFEDVDQSLLTETLELASLEKLAERLPEGVATSLGDYGRAISVGQRQRVSIARALYRKPSVIILDEATSALDSINEREIMKNLMSLSPARTIVLVTHKLSAARMCDRLFVLDEGRIVGRGSYEEVLETCPLFQELITVAR